MNNPAGLVLLPRALRNIIRCGGGGGDWEVGKVTLYVLRNGMAGLLGGQAEGGGVDVRTFYGGMLPVGCGRAVVARSTR